MGESSIRSGIQFDSYKIDKVVFELVPETGVLAKKNHSDCEVKYQFGFRDALRFKKGDLVSYVTGLRVMLSIFDKEMGKDIASGEFIITGLFSSTGELNKDVEETLIKVQAPTILFPYVRSAITMTLTTAGFSTIILPLVNVAAIAKTLSIKIDNADMKAE